MTHIYVDADGCPVKDETCRVAKRYGVPVTFVANAQQRLPEGVGVELVVVGQGFDEADDWIVEKISDKDIAVTTDILLADRCLKKGARVLCPKGRVFSLDSIGEAVASREVASQLREHGLISGGPAPFTKQDRSRFLQRLDEAINACLRSG